MLDLVGIPEDRFSRVAAHICITRSSVMSLDDVLPRRRDKYLMIFDDN